MDPWCPINAPLRLGTVVDQQLLTSGTGEAAPGLLAGPRRRLVRSGSARIGRNSGRSACRGRSGSLLPGSHADRRYPYRDGSGVFGFDPSPKFRQTFGARRGISVREPAGRMEISSVLTRPQNRMPLRTSSYDQHLDRNS